MAEENTSGYLNRLESIRKHIDSNCDRLIEVVNGHKSNLHVVINDLEREFVDLENIRENEISRLKQVMTEYESKSGNDNRQNEVQTRVLITLQNEVQNLEDKNYEKEVEFKWKAELERDLAMIGNVEVDGKLVLEIETAKEVNEDKDETVETKEDIQNDEKDEQKEAKAGEEVVPKEPSCLYTSFVHPSVESYTIGSESDQLSGPAGVAVCHDNSFYIADSNNNRVSVYTEWGKLKFSFQQLGLMGFVNNMQEPWGVCCHGNNVYVTESKIGKQYAALKMFDLTGKYLTGVTKFGNEEGELYDPTGLDFDTRTEDVYVCDRLNHRVQVFTQNLVFKGIFMDRFIYKPRDVKVTPQTVFILDGNDPCMHLFNKMTCRIKTHIITQGPNRDVQSGWFFALDAYGHLLVSDRDSNLIAVFSQEGKLLCKVGGTKSISFVKPAGIAVNALGNIICASEKPFGCVQIL